MTTELQRVVAEKFGIGVVDTLTGFKYIGEKLKKYEDAILADKKGDYRSLTEEESRKLRWNTPSFSFSWRGKLWISRFGFCPRQGRECFGGDVC